MKELDEIRAAVEGLTDLCQEHLRQSIRHVQRNCDIDCNDHEDDGAWDLCNQPGRYDGERMARALASIPRLLAAVEAVEAVHLPIMEFDKPVGCAMCDWDAAGGGEWPCQTRTAITAALTPTLAVPSGAGEPRGAVVAPMDVGAELGPEQALSRKERSKP